MLIVGSGRWRMDSRKVKALFGGKSKMLGVDEVAAIVGHEVGGVRPFGLKTPLPVYCDVSWRAFDEAVPAGRLDPPRRRLPLPSKMLKMPGTGRARHAA